MLNMGVFLWAASSHLPRSPQRYLHHTVDLVIASTTFSSMLSAETSSDVVVSAASLSPSTHLLVHPRQVELRGPALPVHFVCWGPSALAADTTQNDPSLWSRRASPPDWSTRSSFQSGICVGLTFADRVLKVYVLEVPRKGFK